MPSTTHDIKNTTRTQHDTMDVVSVPARHDGGLCLAGNLGTQCRYEHDTKTRLAHLNTTNLGVSIRLWPPNHLSPNNSPAASTLLHGP
jgi:hypothetical protein